MTSGRRCRCGRPICRQNRSGRCASCAQLARNTPALIARRANSLRRRLATDPALRGRYAAQLDAQRAGPANDYRVLRLRAAKSPGWLAVEYRPLWRELRHQGLTREEARAAIENQMIVDAREFARTGVLQRIAAP